MSEENNDLTGLEHLEDLSDLKPLNQKELSEKLDRFKDELLELEDPSLNKLRFSEIKQWIRKMFDKKLITIHQYKSFSNDISAFQANDMRSSRAPAVLRSYINWYQNKNNFKVREIYSMYTVDSIQDCRLWCEKFIQDNQDSTLIYQHILRCARIYWNNKKRGKGHKIAANLARRELDLLVDWKFLHPTKVDQAHEIMVKEVEKYVKYGEDVFHNE